MIRCMALYSAMSSQRATALLNQRWHSDTSNTTDPANSSSPSLEVNRVKHIEETQLAELARTFQWTAERCTAQTGRSLLSWSCWRTPCHCPPRKISPVGVWKKIFLLCWELLSSQLDSSCQLWSLLSGALFLKAGPMLKFKTVGGHFKIKFYLIAIKSMDRKVRRLLTYRRSLLRNLCRVVWVASRMLWSRAACSPPAGTPGTCCGNWDIRPAGPGPGCWPGWSGSWSSSLCCSRWASCPGWSCTSPPPSSPRPAPPAS